jgi:hypothetical protein
VNVLTNQESLKKILIDFRYDKIYFDSKINYSHV